MTPEEFFNKMNLNNPNSPEEQKKRKEEKKRKKEEEKKHFFDLLKRADEELKNEAKKRNMSPDDFLQMMKTGKAPENTPNIPKVVKSKRPTRDKYINNEDITNLKIALETSKSLDEFFEMV